GIGIEEKYKERVFERFFRVDKSHSKQTGGTGLGLSIVKHAALMHDAEIEIKSKVQEGTEIKIIFNKA
ncbi:MAG: ATP-binding protein, partial [Oscillospiraceae bacterium]